MSETVDSLPSADTGLAALLMILRFHGVAADGAQIRHRLGGIPIGVPEIIRVAREFGLKARGHKTSWRLLGKTPLPAIAALRDGGFVILGRLLGQEAAAATENAGSGAEVRDRILVQFPLSSRPQIMTRTELEEAWDGHLVLMVRRASLMDLTRRFDFSWFLGAIRKYRRLLAEVLVVSFFLQVFALVSPLVFQVVIDKVLTHRSMSTLDVLMTALVAISVFEAILGALRTYLFSHTTNRIDVELGARLFRHLMALPLAYFQARRAGDSVARVRELENIRNFLTSSALTLVVDLFFTFVFLAVMFFYSPMLTGIVLASFPFYVAISAGATPLFRRRLDEKFRRGAENQAFLVESVAGVETLKRWRSSRRCSGAGRSSLPPMSRRASG
jgi:ATP-binding cassette, subfamily B, bacterial HlyB/CyaB